MKVQRQRENFITWPKFSFKEFGDIEIEDPTSRIIYKSLIGMLLLPETLVGVFKDIVNQHNKKVIN